MTLQTAHDPAAAPVRPVDPAYVFDPYPTLRTAQTDAPVHHDDTGYHAWFVLRHEDVDPMLRNSARYSHDPRKGAPGTYMEGFLAGLEDESLSMLFLDAPDHTRLRGLVNRAFTPRAVEALRPRMEQIAEELLDAAEAPAFDLIAALAGPFPTIVIAEMLGVDPADRLDFKAWSDSGVRLFDPTLSDEERQRSFEDNLALRDYFARVIAERRAAPRADLISGLIAAQEEDGDRLSDDEMIGTCGLLLSAGNVTTTDLIGNGVLALLQHPDQLRMLQHDPSLIANAVEEMLRYDSPVTEAGRIPLEDVAIAGCPIARGQTIIPSLAGANRDPSVYPDPDRFDITREDTHHHSFGGGPHFCLGAPLARLEAQVAIGALVRRFPKIRLADAEPQRRFLPGFRGLLSLPVLVD